jgi:hypothetical protein
MVRRWLTGLQAPPLETCVAIADLTGVELEWLATGRGPMLNPQGRVIAERAARQEARAILRDWYARFSEVPQMAETAEAVLALAESIPR